MNTLVICGKCGKTNRVALEPSRRGVPICGQCKSELPVEGAVQSLDLARLKRLIEIADRPVVVDFWAPWCGPCRMFAPVFAKSAGVRSDRYIFAKLDTEAAPEAAQEFGIRGIPTLIVFKNGRELDRQSGAMPEDVFSRYLDRF